MYKSGSRKLAGNPRSNPVIKNNGMWKKCFSVLCPFYKDAMRFCWFYLSSNVREFAVFGLSPHFWTTQKCCIQMYVVLTSSEPSLHIAVTISLKAFKIVFRPFYFATLERLLWFIFFYTHIFQCSCCSVTTFT